MIDRLSWYEKKNENDKSTSLGYGARFDPLFKGVKVHDNGNTVYCVFNVPWWMTDDPLPNLSHAVKTVLIKKYHIVPNIHESETELTEEEEGKEAYKDYLRNAGPKYADRKKKPSKSKPKRKICRCEK